MYLLLVTAVNLQAGSRAKYFPANLQQTLFLWEEFWQTIFW